MHKHESFAAAANILKHQFPSRQIFCLSVHCCDCAYDSYLGTYSTPRLGGFFCASTIWTCVCDDSDAHVACIPKMCHTDRAQRQLYSDGRQLG